MITYEFLDHTKRIPLEKMKQIVTVVHQLDTFHQNLIDSHPTFRKIQYQFTDGHFDATREARDNIPARRHDIFTASDNDEVIGIVYVAQSGHSEQAIDIGSLYVNPRYRGNGIAHELFNQVHTHYKGRFQYSSLFVIGNNTAARKFYAKMQYKDAPEGSFVNTSKFAVTSELERLQDKDRDIYFTKFYNQPINGTSYAAVGGTVKEMTDNLNKRWGKSHIFKITCKDTTYYAVGFIKMLAYIFDTTTKKDIDIITATLLNEYNNDALLLFANHQDTMKQYQKLGYELFSSMMYKPL